MKIINATSTCFAHVIITPEEYQKIKECAIKGLPQFANTLCKILNKSKK